MVNVIEASKRLAAWTAVDKHILPEHKVRLNSLLRRRQSLIGWLLEGHWHWLWCVKLSLFPRGDAQICRIGSTVPYVVERIVAQGKELNKDRVFIPTGEYSSIYRLTLRACFASGRLPPLIRRADPAISLAVVRLDATILSTFSFLKPSVIAGFQSKELIVQSDLRLGDVDQYPTIDVTIDGADE